MPALLPPTSGKAPPDKGMFPASTVMTPTPSSPLLPPPSKALMATSPARPQIAQANQPNPDYTAARRSQLEGELSSMRAPEAPKLDDVPKPPPFEQTSPFAGIAPVMMVLAGLAAGKTRTPATTMLNSFAEFNKARHAGDIERMTAAHTAWKDAAQAVVDTNKARSDEFKAAVEGNKGDQRAIQAELTALYTANKDYAMLEKLNTDGGFKLAQESHMAAMDATNQLKAFIDSQYKGVGVPGAPGSNPTGNAVVPEANPKLPNNEFHIDIKDPVGNVYARPADRAKANLNTDKANQKTLSGYQEAVDAVNVQDAEMERFEALAKSLPPAYLNRSLTSLAGSGYSSILDEANKINIKQSLASAPKAAGRNLGVKMEQLLMQASPGPAIKVEANLNLIALQKALNANLRDRAEFVNVYTQPQTDASGRSYIPKATDAEAAWQEYLNMAGDRVDVQGKNVVPNPAYVPWQEFFPVRAAAKAGKVPTEKALDFYRLQKTKGTPLQDVVDYLSQMGDK